MGQQIQKPKQPSKPEPQPGRPGSEVRDDIRDTWFPKNP